MAVTKGRNGLPLPRSLASIRAVRRELISLYRQTKGGEVEPQLAGRLAHQLALLVNVTRDHDLEQRITTLEERLAEHQADQRPARRNGNAQHARA